MADYFSLAEGLSCCLLQARCHRSQCMPTSIRRFVLRFNSKLRRSAERREKQPADSCSMCTSKYTYLCRYLYLPGPHELPLLSNLSYNDKHVVFIEIPFVDFLIRATYEDPNREWCFFGGKLHPCNAEETLIGDTDPRYTSVACVERSAVLKRVTCAVKENVSSLLKIATFQNQRSEAFVMNDIDSIAAYFNYFSRWSKRMYDLRQHSGDVARYNMPCLVLDDCPIFSTLSRFTASHYAAMNNISMFVEKRYLLVALSFAFLLHDAGFGEHELNVFPSTHGTFPRETPSRCISGVVAADSLSSVVTSIKWQLNISNIYFKNKSACNPFLILKLADIDSAVKCLLQSIQYREVLWFPNIVYVEEPVYEAFIGILKFEVNLARQRFVQGFTEAHLESVNAVVVEKNAEGYEVLTLHYLFHSCLFILNCEFSSLGSPVGKYHNLISIVPVRYDTEGVEEMNKTRGLCASVWTNSVTQAASIPLNLKYGTVWINSAARYDPAVPLPMWNTVGVGSLSGKRMLYDNLTPSSYGCYGIQEACLYEKERNSMFPRKTVSSVVKNVFAVMESWGKTPTNLRLKSLQNAAESMKENWSSHKIVFNKTPDEIWEKSVDALQFWGLFLVEKTYNQTFFAHNCMVMCDSQPVGIVAILAGTLMLDRLLFYVACALAYGNVVIVGFSTDELSSAIAVELEKLFDNGLVSVVMDTRLELWKQFTTNPSIVTVWVYRDANSSKTPLTRVVNHQMVLQMHIDHYQQFEEIADRMETYVTKAKCIWLPCLNGTVDNPTLQKPIY